jgi:methanogenic corrinoid protein MtbC1
LRYSTQSLMRIGALSRRVGVSVDTLRAWERRYELLAPVRTDSGFRLYSAADEAKVRSMLAHMASGLAPAQAAGLARTGTGVVNPGGADRGRLERHRLALLDACLEFDAEGAHRVIDEVFASYGLPTVINDVLFWCLREIGDRWQKGKTTVAAEHFASSVIRERMLGLARDWDAGHGPRALLACPVNERHDIGLIGLGLALGRLGWRITFLGPDTPAESLLDAAGSLRPEVVVLSALTPGAYAEAAAGLRTLAISWPVVLSGPGATASLAGEIGAQLAQGDPVSVAEEIAAGRAGALTSIAGPVRT